MFITGPDVVKTVTGEEVTLEELGGAMSHATKSGVATFVAADEKACLDDVRYLLGFLPSNNLEEPPWFEPATTTRAACPELLDLMPDSPNQPYDMKKVIRPSSTTASSSSTSRHWAGNIVCGFARLDGHPVGIVGNQPRCWPACSTSSRPRRRPASCAPATRSTSRSSRSSTCPASCPASTRSTAASSATAPSCSTPTARRPCPASRSSPARPTAAPTWS